MSDLPSVIKKYKITIHHSMKMSPIQAFKKVNKKLVFDNLKNRRQKQKPKFKLGQLVRTADNKKIFSKGDSTNSSDKLFPISEVLHDTIPSYRINYLTGRYIQNLSLTTKLTLEENNQVMKKLNLSQY